MVHHMDALPMRLPLTDSSLEADYTSWDLLMLKEVAHVSPCRPKIVVAGESEGNIGAFSVELQYISGFGGPRKRVPANEESEAKLHQESDQLKSSQSFLNLMNFLRTSLRRG